MGMWPYDSACWVVHDDRLYSMLDTVVLFGEYVCCSVVFGTLDGVSVFRVMWSECGMFVICCMQCCMSMSTDCSAWMCCLEEVYKCLR